MAGRYSHTYNAIDTGISEKGYRLSQGAKAAIIGESDAYGESALDFVYRGGDVHMQYESLAYKAGSISPFWPWGAMGAMGLIGRLASDVAAASVLTAVAGTSAATAPATCTASKAILAPNNPVELLFSSELRKVPTRLMVLPVDAGSGVIKWFVFT